MLIDGRKIADGILDELKTQVLGNGKKIKLAAVMLGEHPGSLKFLELKQQAAEKIGLSYEIYKVPADSTLGFVQEKIRNIASMGETSGIIVELPLPGHLPVQQVLDAIPAEKDVDVLSAQSQGLYFADESDILPPSAEAVKIILEQHQVDIKGKAVAIFGYGLLVGKQVGRFLARNFATISVINEFTKDPTYYSKQADIIISGVGKPKLITADMVKEGAIIIDFGYENVDGATRGDVDFEPVSQKASLITPVPGGVGPIVIAAVLKNLLRLNS